MNKEEEEQMQKSKVNTILQIYLQRKEREDAERKFFLDSMLKITGGKGFTIIVNKNKKK